ncbi:MAG: OsmC family protein [Anaerolineae bacterium]|nr:OsmC family protein [Anaerolineae bacterium]
MGARVTWKDGLSFSGTADSGFNVDLSAGAGVGGAEDGFRPMELLATGLAGCTAMDVISILQKKRQDVTAFEVRVHTKSADEHPHVWTWVQIEYLVTGNDIDPAAVERAMQLSADKYCPAQNMINKAVDIDLTYTIIEAGKA